MKIEADIDGLIQLVCTAIETYTTAFFLADNRKRVLKLYSYYSLSDNVIEDAIIPFDYGPIGWVAENSEPFDLSKFSDRDSGMLKLYSKNEDIKSFAAEPVMKNKSLIGVLCVDSKRAFVFTRKDQKLINMFSKLFADFVNNMKLMELIDTDISGIVFLHDFCKELASATKIESILELTLKSIIRLLKCDDCFICFSLNSGNGYFRVEEAYHHQSLKNTIFTEKNGLAGCVISNREPIILANRKRGFKSDLFTSSKSVSHFSSFLGVPLLAQDRILGLICVIDSQINYFNQRDLQVVTIMGNNMAMAVSDIKNQEKVVNLSKLIPPKELTDNPA